MVKKEEFLFDSRDGKSRIHAVRWVPEGKICCILQVVHGMAEFVERYEPMAMYLGEKGIMVTGEDASRTWKKCRRKWEIRVLL